MVCNILKYKTKIINIKHLLTVLVGLSVVLSVFWILMLRLEGGDPSIKLELPSSSIGVSYELKVSVTDEKSSIRRIWIGLLKDGEEIDLFKKEFPFPELFSGWKIHKESFNILIEPKKLGITDGKAILRIVSWDYSWSGLGNGNRAYVENNIMIDTMPPEIDILSKTHNLSQGGAGLVIYRISEQCPKSGVYVGENFFPGHSGYFKDQDIFLAFIAFYYKQGPETQIFAKAIDKAGNSTRAGFPYYIKKKKFKKDVINISDKFLNWKIPEFESYLPKDSKTSVVDNFLMINRKMREENYKEIAELGEKTEKVIYWNGGFLRLPQAARRAGFADYRTYKYKGRIIDHQTHLGIDLASISHSKVPASNKGKVVFAGYMGIYGRTVIIDHGFGLLSMYSHLSRTDVKKGQIVSKGENIGRTGSTGLAGGDHLHFAMLVHNTFVNPIEWWDAAWIENNISAKIDAVISD